MNPFSQKLNGFILFDLKCLSACSTSSFVMRSLMCHPTILREYKSITLAR